jgi:hypothetical protein
VNCWQRLLFPDPPRTLPGSRAWNIACRTAHIGVIGVLFGGQVFEIPKPQLLVWLFLSIATGAGLIAIEAFPHARWCYQGRGLLTLAKLLLLCLVPWLWGYRVAILTVVIVLGSVGSHMPRWFRYYSFVDRRVIEDVGSNKRGKN